MKLECDREGCDGTATMCPALTFYPVPEGCEPGTSVLGLIVCVHCQLQATVTDYMDEAGREFFRAAYEQAGHPVPDFDLTRLRWVPIDHAAAALAIARRLAPGGDLHTA